MATFKAGGRDWRVEIGYAAVRRLRTEAGVDLSGADGQLAFVQALYTDPFKLGAVLWCLCRDEAQAAGLTEEQFFDAMTNDEAEAAAAAVYEGYVDFFHRGRAAAVKPKLPGLIRTMNEKVGAALATAIDSFSNDSAASAPASPESTPGT